MPINVRRVWLTDSGEVVPETDARLYNTRCDKCRGWFKAGVARHEGEFLCLGCLDDELRPEISSGGATGDHL